MDMENLIAAFQSNHKNCLGFSPCSKGSPWPWGGCLQNHPVKFLELAAKVSVVPSAIHCSAPSLTTLEFVSGSTKKRD